MGVHPARWGHVQVKAWLDGALRLGPDELDPSKVAMVRGEQLLALGSRRDGPAVLADTLGLHTLGGRKRLAPALKQLSQLTLADRRMPLPPL